MNDRSSWTSVDIYPQDHSSRWFRCTAKEETYLLTQLDGMPCRANSVNWRWSVVPEASLQLLPPTTPPSGGAGAGVKEGDGGQKERK